MENQGSVKVNLGSWNENEEITRNCNNFIMEPASWISQVSTKNMPKICYQQQSLAGCLVNSSSLYPSLHKHSLTTTHHFHERSGVYIFRIGMMKVFKCEGSLILPKAFHYQESRNRFCSRRRLRIISNSSNENFDSNVKKAKLSARKKDRVNIPSYNDLHGRGKKIYPIREFLSHPSGIEALLNTQALQKFEQLDLTTYRCTLPQLNLLNFEVYPVIDLRVTPTTEDCMVELLCCKFEGSEVVTQQNEHFSAEMTNYITWCTKNSEPYLDVDVTLDLTLEIYTQPFTMLPTSAVEVPGSLMMQALVDRLVPLLLQQLIQDYGRWLLTQNPESNFITSNSA